ncbi:hypothetical protein BDN71DRAFT_1454312, partial [Pleurotus eryngii]
FSSCLSGALMSNVYEMRNNDTRSDVANTRAHTYLRCAVAPVDPHSVANTCLAERKLLLSRIHVVDKSAGMFELYEF